MRPRGIPAYWRWALSTPAAAKQGHFYAYGKKQPSRGTELLRALRYEELAG